MVGQVGRPGPAITVRGSDADSWRVSDAHASGLPSPCQLHGLKVAWLWCAALACKASMAGPSRWWQWRGRVPAPDLAGPMPRACASHHICLQLVCHRRSACCPAQITQTPEIADECLSAPSVRQGTSANMDRTRLHGPPPIHPAPPGHPTHGRLFPHMAKPLNRRPSWPGASGWPAGLISMRCPARHLTFAPPARLSRRNPPIAALVRQPSRSFHA